MSAETHIQEPVASPVAAVPDPAPEHPCPACGAGLAPGQEWCLECGAGRPRTARRAVPWRGPTGALVVAGVLAAGAVTAAYAGLRADDHAVARNAGAQAAVPAAAPATTQAPAPAPITPPTSAAPPPSKATPPPAAAKPAVKAPTSVTPPPAAAPRTPVVAAKPAPKAAHAPVTRRAHRTPAPRLAAVDLAHAVPAVYNPFAHPATDFNDPKLAIDADPSTAWTSAVADGQQNDVAIGIDLDLRRLVGVRAVDVVTPTPGITLEVYGTTKATAPSKLDDKAWTHLATQLDVGSKERIRVGDGTDRFRHVLVWVTEAPPGATQVGLADLKVLR